MKANYLIINILKSKIMKMFFKQKSHKKSSNKELCNYGAIQYYQMDSFMEPIPFDNETNQMINCLIDRASNQYPFPNGEVVKCNKGENTWWVSSDPTSLFAAIENKKEPMYYMIEQPGYILEIYNQNRLIDKIELNRK